MKDTQYILRRLEYLKHSRNEIEKVWLESWRAYIHSRSTIQRSRATENSAGPPKSWKHTVSTGKVYELVESFVSFLTTSLIVGPDYFEVKFSPSYPLAAQTQDTLTDVKEYLRYVLDEADFVDATQLFIRQLAITGVSVLHVPWYCQREYYRYWDFDPIGNPTNNSKVKTGDKLYHPNFKVIDVSDCWWDPTNLKGDLFVRKMLTYSDAIKFIPAQNLSAVASRNPTAKLLNLYTERGLTEDFTGTNEFYEVYEYYGSSNPDDPDPHIVQAYVHNGEVYFEKNPYWVRPYILSGLVSLPSVEGYPISLVESILGLSLAVDKGLCQQLDNNDIVLNAAFTKLPDSLFNLGVDASVVPGRIYECESHDVIRPIPWDTRGLQLLSQEQRSNLSADIHSTAGMPPLLTSGMGRQAERVTTREIDTVREAGGNRLSLITTHLEKNYLEETLNTVLHLSRQFVRENRDYFIKSDLGYYSASLNVLVLQQPLIIKAKGISTVVQTQRQIDSILQLLQISANQEIASRVNWDAIHEKLMSLLFYGQDYEQFIATPEPAPQEEQGLFPVNEALLNSGSGENMISFLQ